MIVGFSNSCPDLTIKLTVAFPIFIQLKKKKTFSPGLQWQLALHLFHAMQLLHPNVVSFNALLSATEKSSAWQQTLRIFGDRRRHRKRSDVDVDVISFNAALGACCKGRQWQLALKLFHQMLVDFSRLLSLLSLTFYIQFVMYLGF